MGLSRGGCIDMCEEMFGGAKERLRRGRCIAKFEERFTVTKQTEQGWMHS